MGTNEAIKQLKELAEQWKHIVNTNPYVAPDVWSANIEAMEMGIAALSGMQELREHPGLGLCVICRYKHEKLNGRHCGKCIHSFVGVVERG